MTDTVLQVGSGVFIIAVVWIAALVLAILLLRADGSAKLGVIPVFLLALTITLTLVLFPRSPETPPPFKEVESNSNIEQTLPMLPQGSANKPEGFAKQAAAALK